MGVCEMFNTFSEGLSGNDYLTRSTPLSLDPNLHGNTVLHRLHVTDHADHAALRLEGLEGVNCQIQTFSIKCSEAFVDEQRTRDRTRPEAEMCSPVPSFDFPRRKR